MTQQREHVPEVSTFCSTEQHCHFGAETHAMRRTTGRNSSHLSLKYPRLFVFAQMLSNSVNYKSLSINAFLLLPFYFFSPTHNVITSYIQSPNYNKIFLVSSRFQLKQDDSWFALFFFFPCVDSASLLANSCGISPFASKHISEQPGRAISVCEPKQF